MEIRFWQYLTKEPTDLDALPLKQRIPEVALFRGCALQAGFFSNQRGLLQKRDGKQFSKQFLLDRLLALSAKTAEATDLCAQTPVAILRRHAAGVAGPPKAHVLNASQLMELLERTERGFVPDCPALPHLEDGEEWSLQSLIVPPTNLRVVSVYSRENGEECFDLVGQPFSQVYPLDGKDPSPGSSSSSNSMRSVFIPDAFASQVEAKSKHLVAYVQRFHGRGLGSLISEFIPDDSGKAVLHGFWKVDMLEGKTMMYTASGLDSPMPSTAVPSVAESNHTSRPTSAAQSRPVSATSKETEWVSSPRSVPEARANQGNQGNQGSVAVNAARKVMSISEDLHIQEDYSEDNELEEAIERIRASEPYTRRAARCGRTAPQVSAPKMATSEFDSASARDGGLGAGAKQSPQPASQSTSSFDDIQARTAALSGRIRPRSAEQRSYGAGSQSSRPSSARSVRSRANWSVQSTPARSVVGNIRCDQLISRHLPEREARSRMISVLARQLERLRDHIPAFAQQWQTVEAFISLCQQRVADKAKEVEALEEEIRVLQKLHARQYDLLDQGLQRQVEEAKSAWIWVRNVAIEFLQCVGFHALGKLWQYFQSLENLADFLRILATGFSQIALVTSWDEFETNQVLRVIFAITGFVRWLRVLNSLKGFESTGKPMLPILQAVPATLPFFIVVLCWFSGFMHMYYSFGLTDWWTSGMIMYRLGFLADFSRNEMVAVEVEDIWAFWVDSVLVFMGLSMSIIMMNILIGVLAESYNRGWEHRERLFLLERSRLVLQHFTTARGWSKICICRRQKVQAEIDAQYVWFAYPKDPASWGEIQADNDADSAMNVHEKVTELRKEIRDMHEDLVRGKQDVAHNQVHSSCSFEDSNVHVGKRVTSLETAVHGLKDKIDQILQILPR